MLLWRHDGGRRCSSPSSWSEVCPSGGEEEKTYLQTPGATYAPPAALWGRRYVSPNSRSNTCSSGKVMGEMILNSQPPERCILLRRRDKKEDNYLSTPRARHAPPAAQQRRDTYLLTPGETYVPPATGWGRRYLAPPVLTKKKILTSEPPEPLARG